MAHSDTFVVRFWGVRGSCPAPGRDTLRYGGETTCLEVRIGRRLIIIDGGTGIRNFGQAFKIGGERDADILFTHTHLDHICGLPFFDPAFDANNSLRLWAGHLPDEATFRSAIGQILSPPVMPMALSELKACTFEVFRPGERLPLGPDITVDTMALNHPGGAVGYRICAGRRALCIITDHEHGDPRYDNELARFVRDADVMIYDSSFSDAEYPAFVGWGHSTWQQAIALAKAEDVRIPVIFHHEPSRSDHELDRIAEEAVRLNPGAVVAEEGMEIVL